MSRIDDNAADLRAMLPGLVENNDAAELQRVLTNNAAELLWIAEVMEGSRQAGAQSLARAIELARVSPYVGCEWMLPWVTRLLVHVVLKHISGEIRESLPPAEPRSFVAVGRAVVSAPDQRMLRSISAQRIISSFDALERACFILYAYLQYPMLDCALLLGCPRAWIAPVCERVLLRIVDIGHPPQDCCRDIASFTLPEVRECAS